MTRSIGAKLITSFLVVAALGLAGGLIGIWGIQSVGKASHTATDEKMPVGILSLRMRHAMAVAGDALAEVMGVKDTKQLESEVKRYKEQLVLFKEATDMLLGGGKVNQRSFAGSKDKVVVKLVQDANVLQRTRFQKPAESLIAAKRMLLQQLGNRKKAMISMEQKTAAVDSQAKDIEARAKLALSRGAQEKATTTRFKRLSALLASASDLRLRWALSRLVLEEYVQTDDPAEAKKLRKEYDESNEQTLRSIKGVVLYSEGAVNPAEIARMKLIRELAQKQKNMQSIIKKNGAMLIRAHDLVIQNTGVLYGSMEKLDKGRDECSAALGKVEVRAMAEITKSIEAADSAKNWAIWLMAIMTVLAFVSAVLLGVIISRGISRGIGTVVDAATQIAKGDLTQVVKVDTKDELGTLADAYNTMVANLSNVVTSIRQTSDSVASAAEEISAATEQIARGAESQASAADETSASMEQMSVSIQNIANATDGLATNVDETTSSIQQLGASAEGVARNTESMASNVSETSATIEQLIVALDRTAQNVADADAIAKEAVSESKTGGESVMQTVAGMRSLSESMTEVATVIESLGQRSDAIGDIVNVIEDIADQTNLLALNAAIEAARAGQAGKGFAVVAEEVRKLAERSIKATKEISDVIKLVQSETALAVKATASGAKESEAGIVLADKAGEAMSSIMQGAQKSSNLLSEVSDMMSEQTTSARAVIKAVEEMNRLTIGVKQATEEQASGVGQVIQAAETMSQMTDSVRNATVEQKSGGANVIKAVENISEIAKNNLSAVEQLSTSARDMAAQSEGMQELMQQFKVA